MTRRRERERNKKTRHRENGMRKTMIQIADIVVEQYAKMQESINQIVESVRGTQETWDRFISSPYGRVISKMNSSRGVLHVLDGSERVLFVPEAVKVYGFAHLPTRSDPDGRLHEELPAKPDRFGSLTGSYLFLKDPSEGRTVDPRYSAFMVTAKETYEIYGRKGYSPAYILAVLTRDSGMEEIWVEVNPNEDLDTQFKQFKKRLTKIEKSIHGSKGAKRSKRREVARDTLMQVMKFAGFSIRDIALRTYGRTSESLEQQVIQSLHRTREALKASKGEPTLEDLP